LNATPGPAPKDAADVAASIIGKTLSDDAVFRLRLAVYLGAARAKERNIPLVAYASWRNLMGAALLAPDPASRWLQAKRADFDLDELLPAPPARLTALRAASDGQARLMRSSQRRPDKPRIFSPALSPPSSKPPRRWRLRSMAHKAGARQRRIRQRRCTPCISSAA